MDIPVTEEKTSSGVPYTLVQYVTGRVGSLLGFMAQSAKTPDENVSLQDKMIESCVKSVNGSVENIVESVKDLPLKDYKEIVEKVANLFTGLDDQKKTK